MTRVPILAMVMCQVFICTPAPAKDYSEAGSLLQALHNVQDDIARGDILALKVQAELIDRLGASLESPLNRTGDRLEWETIAIGYALDGAKPQTVSRLLSTIGSESPLHKLALAVSLYSLGNMKDAAIEFDRIPLDIIDQRLAPYVAIAAGTANLTINEDKASAFFQKAILIAPGTLVEEVATRRLASMAAEKGDATSLQRFANIYLRRYASSPLARQFYGVLVDAMPKLFDYKSTIHTVDVIAQYAMPNHIDVLLLISEKNAVLGKMDVVKYLSENYFADPSNKPKNIQQKFLLYNTISDDSDKNQDEKLRKLKSIDPSALSKSELTIHGKSVSTLEAMLKPLDGSSSDTNADLAKKLYKRDVVASEEPAKSGNAKAATNAESGAQAPVDHAASPVNVSATPSHELDPTGAPAPVPEAKDPLFEEIDTLTNKASSTIKSLDTLLEETRL